MTMSKLSKETIEDLQRSGITRKSAERMGVQDVSSEALLCLYASACKTIGQPPPRTLNGVSAYELPYLDLAGQHTGYSRYKIFGEYIPSGDKRSVKYLQLPGTKPRFYFPPFCNWQRIAQDTAIPIYFVEGEKKAAALSLHGLPTIGAGGVWSWRSRGNDDTSDPIPDFNLINWKGRKTVIAFDADV
jgi:hypothetical protein